MHAHKVENIEMMLSQITVPFLCCLIVTYKEFHISNKEGNDETSKTPCYLLKYQIPKSKI